MRFSEAGDDLFHQLVIGLAVGELRIVPDDRLGTAEENALLAGLQHVQIVEAVADGDGLVADGLEGADGGELGVFDPQLKAVDHAVVAHGQLVAEQRWPAQLLHQGAGELREGVADDDGLGEAAQLVQEFLCARQRVDLGDGLLDFLQAEAVLTQNAEAPVHELGVIRLVPGGAAELGDAADLRKRDPDFRDKDALKVKADHIHNTFLLILLIVSEHPRKQETRKRYRGRARPPG